MSSPATRRRTLDVLFVSGFDSANFAYVELLRELQARGHRCTVLVDSDRDSVNTSMFGAAGIPTKAIADYRTRDLDSVDLVFAGPHLRPRARPLVAAIQRRGIFVVSLANLFSAVTMWVAPDLVIAGNSRKLEELEANGLRYRAVAVGNPQYDPLVRARVARAGAPERPVRRVLVVDQGAYPLGETGKRQLAETLVAIARNNPELEFHVKPRHLPDEQGDQVHSVSDHLYAHLTDAPANMTLIRTPTVIEELLPDFDAMITTWSTAHLGAVALGIPLLIIGGLDSVDVYDVRRQRVAEAYEHLRATGCVFDWRELRTGPVPFARVAPAYVAQEFDDPDVPSAPRIADLLEGLDVAAEPNRDRVERDLRIGLNTVIQHLVFDNRCMGFALDMRRMLPFWERRPEAGSGKRGVDAIVREARAMGLALKAEYFAAHPDEVASDVFIQDAYFDWLLASGRRAELAAWDGPIVAPESLEFDQGIALLRTGRIVRASRHLVESFSISLQRPLRILKKNKDVKVLLSRVDTSPLALAILVFLSLYRKDDALAALEVPQRRGAEPLAYQQAKALVRLGRQEEAASALREYANAVAGEAGTADSTRRNRVLSLAISWYRARLRRLAKRLG